MGLQKRESDLQLLAYLHVDSQCSDIEYRELYADAISGEVFTREAQLPYYLRQSSQTLKACKVYPLYRPGIRYPGFRRQMRVPNTMSRSRVSHKTPKGREKTARLTSLLTFPSLTTDNMMASCWTHMSIPKTGNRKTPNEWPIDSSFARTKSSDGTEHIGLVSKYLLVDPARKQLRLYPEKPEDLDDAYCGDPKLEELERAFNSQMSIAECDGKEPADTHFLVRHWGFGPVHNIYKRENSPTLTEELSDDDELPSPDASSTEEQSPACVGLAHRTPDKESPDARTEIDATGQELPAEDYSISVTPVSPQEDAQFSTVMSQNPHAASIAVNPERRSSSASDSSFVPTSVAFDFDYPADMMDLDQTEAKTFTDGDYLPKDVRDQMEEATNLNLGSTDLVSSHGVSRFVSLDMPPSSQLADYLLADYLLEDMSIDTPLPSDDDVDMDAE